MVTNEVDPKPTHKTIWVFPPFSQLGTPPTPPLVRITYIYKYTLRFFLSSLALISFSFLAVSAFASTLLGPLPYLPHTICAREDRNFRDQHRYSHSARKPQTPPALTHRRKRQIESHTRTQHVLTQTLSKRQRLSLGVVSCHTTPHFFVYLLARHINETETQRNFLVPLVSFLRSPTYLARSANGTPHTHPQELKHGSVRTPPALLPSFKP